jgi:hypothetical protein
MPISSAKKTRKHSKKRENQYNKFAKKGTSLKCRMKTSIVKKYQSVYGSASGGKIRSERLLFY